jgi:hypothetical protein
VILEVPTSFAGLRRLWWLALAGGVAAACLAVVFLWWGGGRRDEPAPIAVRPPPTPPALVEDAEPTLLEYHRALARSPQELDALLNKRALVAPESNPEIVPTCGFTRSDAALNALLGED